MFLTLTLPTHISDSSATLIDNIFSNTTNKMLHFSGIIITDISDHFPCFYQLKISRDYVKPDKYMFYRKYNEGNLNKLYHELQSINIMDMLDQNESIDPNINYNILETILINTFDKHIPFHWVKIHKHKHKTTKCKSDPKQTWKIINETINKNAQKYISDYMFINGIKSELTNFFKFCYFFTSSILNAYLLYFPTKMSFT